MSAVDYTCFLFVLLFLQDTKKSKIIYYSFTILLQIIEPFTEKTLRRGCVVFGEQKTKSEMAKLL